MYFNTALSSKSLKELHLHKDTTLLGTQNYLCPYANKSLYANKYFSYCCTITSLCYISNVNKIIFFLLLSPWYNANEGVDVYVYIVALCIRGRKCVLMVKVLVIRSVEINNQKNCLLVRCQYNVTPRSFQLWTLFSFFLDGCLTVDI